MAMGLRLLAIVVCIWLLPTLLWAQHPAGVEPGESYHRIFVTENVFDISSSPSYPPPLSSINGLLGADWHVTLAAFNSGLIQQWNGVDAIYTAILSDSTTNANTRFAISGPVYNTANEKVADDATDFWDGSLDAAIRYDEWGNPVSTSDVWSGSTSLGNHSGQSCGDWMNSSSTCEFGDATSPFGSWLSSGPKNGSNTARLYGISPAITLPESADFNGTGNVNGDDFLTWQRHVGTGAAHAEGDSNGDDRIDTDDLIVWQNQYGLRAVETFADEATFLAAVDGETLVSFESATATNVRDTTTISEAPIVLQSSAAMGVWGAPLTDFLGTHPTDGSQWVVSPAGGSVTIRLVNGQAADALGVTITDFGDNAGSYDLVAEVALLDGSVQCYPLASSGLPDGNEIFWGISTSVIGSPIRHITLTYGGDSIGIDEIYVVAASATSAIAVPEPATAMPLLAALVGLSVMPHKRQIASVATQADLVKSY